MTRPYVYVTRLIAQPALDLIAGHAEIGIWEEDRPIPRDVLLREAANADGLLTMLTDKIDAELIAAAPRLKVISQMAVGYDNIDIAAAAERGIPVGNTPDVLTEATADIAFALLMAAARRLPEGERFVHSGQWKTWSPSLLLGVDVYGKTLGIVGYGRIGQAMARRGRGFNMRILYYNRTDRSVPGIDATRCDLETLLRESDFVSLHTPLTPETYHLIGAPQLALMKPGAILINTARGSVVDPDALYEALAHQRIFAAGLDVTEPEPIPMNSPLLTLDNCLIIPHVGSATIETRQAMAMLAANNLIAGLRGEALLKSVT